LAIAVALPVFYFLGALTTTESNPNSNISSKQKSAEDLYQEAMKYLEGNGVEVDFPKGNELLKKAAEQGHALANHKLGVMYCDEADFLAVSRGGSLSYFRKAAEQGLPESEYWLGILYSGNSGIPQDYVKSFNYFKSAAIKGHIASQAMLGYCYSEGQGVSVDKSKAFKWHMKAANQGEPAAQFNLGEAYDKGEGVPKNLESARGWYRKAAKGGNKEAQERLAKIDKISDTLPPIDFIDSKTYRVSFGSIVAKLGASNYMRTNFEIQSSSNNIEQIIEYNKKSLTEAAIAVLSAQSVDALNSANGREVVRKNLINRFNKVLGDKFVDQISFTEFIIQ
jgi:TPR repeat protein